MDEFHTLKVSGPLLDQIIFALERRIAELNNRGSEPATEQIRCCASALEHAHMVRGKFISCA